MNPYNRLLLSSSLFLGLWATSASGETLDLLQTYQMAVDRDPQLAASEHAAQAGREKRSQSRSFLLPKFDLNGNYDNTYQEVNSGGFDTKENYSVSVNMRQSLVHVGAIVAFKEAGYMVKQSEVALEQARQDVILRVSQSYFNVLSAEESVGVASAQTTAFKESLERAKLTFTVGTATITDKLEAQARYDLAVASEIASKNALAVAKQSLRAIIGSMPDKLIPLNTEATLVRIDPLNLDHWVNKALEQNHQILLGALGVDISSTEVSRLRAERLPTLDLVGRVSDSQNTFINTKVDTQAATVSLELKMPLFTGGYNTSKIRESVALKDQQKETQENVRRQVALQTQQMYLAVDNGLQQVLALQQAMASSKSALDATRKGVEVGVRTNLDLLNSQQQYFSTKRDFTVARYDYLLNVLKLKAVAGELMEADIQEMNSLLALASR